MLKRFSLYGFLKNQQYYDPFIVLAFREMKLSFFMIGILIAFREIMINIMEIPSGAIADLFGKRKSMILSFVSYILSFAVFGFTGLAASAGNLSGTATLFILFPAMFFFAIGDAFRTGTHKAMIFTWLRLKGRTDEKTKVYGYTRSWSKMGSALSVILAAVFVFTTSNYIYIFFFSIIPYILGVINFLGYPKELDGDIKKDTSVSDVIRHLKEAFSVSIRESAIRRLILESMGFEGFFKAAKDYLQPILKNAAVPLTAMFLVSDRLSEPQQAALLVGPVYFVLYLLSAYASRKAHVLVDRHGHEDNTARFIWLVTLLIFAAMAPLIYFRIYWGMILGFLAMYVMQNLFRPVLITRFDTHSDEAKGATILSIESQAKSVATMIIAPCLGWLVDFAQQHGIGQSEFWPVAVFGAVFALLFFVTAKKGKGKGEEAGLV